MTYLIFGFIICNFIFCITLLITIRCRKECIIILPTIVLIEVVVIVLINLISIKHILTSEIEMKLSIDNWLNIALFALVLAVLTIFIMSRFMRVIMVSACFFRDCLPAEILKIDDEYASKKITDEESKIQKKKLYHIVDYNDALSGAAKKLLRFSIGNILVLVAAIVSFIVFNCSAANDYPVYSMINSWRVAILFCNGLLLTLSALFMELSLVASALKGGGIRR